jgi:O-acetylserine/cysteine efflux transporter
MSSTTPSAQSLPQAGLPLSHLLMGLVVTAVWGTNFVIIKFGLHYFPPLMFAFLRFTLVFLPAALFIKRPDVPWWKLAAYGLLIGGGQFGLLFLAMKGHISPGLASLLMQSQAFITIALSIIISSEKVRNYQWVATAIAACGVVLIVAKGGGEVTPLGLGLVLGASTSWALGNMIAKGLPGTGMLGFIVWSSLFAIPPLFALTMVIDGPGALVTAVTHADATGWAALLWQSVGNSLFGYAAWNWLLGRHPTATIAPLSLLIPVFGIGAAVVILGEPLPSWKLGAALFILAGLGLNLFWPRIGSGLAQLRARATGVRP